jgi:hypothetical protein
MTAVDVKTSHFYHAAAAMQEKEGATTVISVGV